AGRRRRHKLALRLRRLECEPRPAGGTSARASGVTGGNMRLSQCCNYYDFRELARRRLPGPIFNYIDGAADDETTYRRNTQAFEDWDLVPRVLTGGAQAELSATFIGQKLASAS